jgi:predicted RNase H-like nuclease
VGSLRKADGTYLDLGSPQVADFSAATDQIVAWQEQCQAAATVIMLDQPTIVVNAAGQRPVENLVSGPVSRRYGGVQPSNTSRSDMFGEAAPVWPFLEFFGGAADPTEPLVGTKVFETYPVLTMIAFDWVRPDVRPTGRLPKYNPERRKTFVLDDWKYVCHLLEAEFRQRGLAELAAWCERAAEYPSPRKHDQDRVDACLCLLAAVHLVERQECLMIGDTATGHIVVPSGSALRAEVEHRCHKTGRSPAEWIKTLNAELPARDEYHDCVVTEHDVAGPRLLSPRS